MDKLVIVRPFFEALKEFMLKERKRLNPWWRKFFLLKPVNPHINEILNWIYMYIDDIKFSNVPTEKSESWTNEARECLNLLILCEHAGMFEP